MKCRFLLNPVRYVKLPMRSWWRHQMKTFSAVLAICAGFHRSPVNSPHKGQWHGALMFALICAWINDWVNNREAGDLRRHRCHYDVIVMSNVAVDGTLSSANWSTLCSLFRSVLDIYTRPLQWRHNKRSGVSNHWRLDCLLNSLFKHISKKTSKFRVLAFVRGIHRSPMDSPHKGQYRGKWLYLMTSSCNIHVMKGACGKSHQMRGFFQPGESRLQFHHGKLEPSTQNYSLTSHASP